MKNLRPQPNARRGLLSSTLSRGILLAAFLIVILFFASESARAVLHAAAAPLWRGGQWVGASAEGFFENFRSKGQLAAENQHLTQELSELSVRLLDRNELYEENLRLKEMQGRDASVNAVLSAVLARPPKSPYDTLVLDAGEREGVSAGDFVAASETLIIGVIERVTPRTSIVRLFSAPGEKTEVLLGQRGPAVEALGRGAGNFEARVPVGISINLGMSVFIPTVTPHVFAVVEHVEFNPSDSSRTVFFRSPVNPFELRFVSILRHGAQ